MRFFKFKVLLFLVTSMFISGFIACETNDVMSDWDAVYDSDPSSPTFDSLYKMTTDSSGGIILIGSSLITKSGSQDEKLFVVKYDSSGNRLWEFKHDFSWQNGIYINDYCIDGENNIYVSGTTDYERALFLVKVSPSGQLLWETTVEREGWLTGGIVCMNGTVYWAHMDLTLVNAATGEISSTTAVNKRMTDIVSDGSGNLYVAGYDFYAGYDKDGALRWSMNWDKPVQAVKLATGRDGSIYAAAGVSSSEYTVSIFRISPSGSIVSRVNENFSNAWNPQLAVDNSGNIIAAVSCEGSLTRTAAKYNSNLTKIWMKNFEASKSYSDLDQMIVDKSGSIYLTGGDLTTKISPSGSRIVSERDSSYYSGNLIALSPDNSKMYIGTPSDDGEITIILSQYSNK